MQKKGEIIIYDACAIFAHMGKEGVQVYNLRCYNLDAILSEDIE